jgi:alpha-L-arabinofuranosidase
MKLFHRIIAAAAFLSASFAISGAAAADNAPADPSQHSVSRHYDPLPPSPRPIQLFAYERDNRLYYAWNADGMEWHAIDHGWLSSDYGAWGAEKKMHDPYLYHDKANGMWYCIFTPNPDDPVFALTSSPDLVHWHVQNYYPMEKAPRGYAPFIYFDSGEREYYYIEWFKKNERMLENVYATRDFKHFSLAESPSRYLKGGSIVKLGGRERSGNIVTITKAELDAILAAKAVADRREALRGERVTGNLRMPRGIRANDLAAEVAVDLNRTKTISPLLWGIFFEDINYSADGGLYAELVRNRDFEFNDLDHGGWNALTGWTVSDAIDLDGWHDLNDWSVSEGAKATVATDDPIHKNNPHYLVLEAFAALVNEGYRGMVFREGDSYLFSVFTKCLDGNEAALDVRLLDDRNNTVASGTVTAKGKEWTKTELKLTANKSTDRGKLALIKSGGKVAIDMVSLFPEKTFKGRRNGLRADLAQTLADLKPRFIRFPGGCVAHGNGLGNMYRWNRTVGPLESRVPQSNIWGYHQSAGLGYYEYFQFCEDIGAEPLPILPAGVPCQNSSRGGKGQQGGIPMDRMDEYIQEVLDLIEWANGPADSKWGKLRAEAGHPAPFNLKYIGIGNEDLIGDVFKERFTMIFEAVKAKHPEITVVGTVGPFCEGSDYEDGWALARKLGIPIVDEHYYQSPGWFLNNQHFYDTYERGGTRVYLGEYASHNGPRTSTIETALSEAIYMISLERNGDVVAMSSYAPLLAKEGDTQWNPDLIYFNNTQVKPTTGYYVQKLFGNNAGDTYARTSANLLNGSRSIPDNDETAPLRKRFASSCVIDSKTNTATVKIANLLPFEVKTTLKLDELGSAPVKATKTVLSGSPDDVNVRPSEPETITLDKSSELTLKPFSLTVLSFPLK